MVGIDVKVGINVGNVNVFEDGVEDFDFMLIVFVLLEDTEEFGGWSFAVDEGAFF